MFVLMSRRYEISDINWVRIAPLMKGKPGDVGRSSADNRIFINTVIWIVRSGAAWRDLPARYGAWNSVYQRFRRWAKTEHWQTIFEALQEPDLDWAMIDLTLIRAHQQAVGQKKVHRKLKPSAEVEAD